MNRNRLAFPVFALGVFLSLTQFALANEQVKVAIDSADPSIRPQEPLSLRLSLEMKTYKGRSVHAVFVNNDDIHMRVYDSAGALVSESKRWSWRCNLVPRYEWLARLDDSPEGRAEKWIVFNEWCSTSLEPGTYNVTCDISELGIIYAGENVSSREFFSSPIKARFSFRVTAKDDDAVRKRFDELLAKAREKAGGKDKEEFARAVELIAYSREPLALPYQLKLLSGVVTMYADVFNDCNAIDLTLHLVEENRPEVAKGLADVFDELQSNKVEMESVSRDFLTQLVLWAIHEMHEHGDAKIKEATEAIVKTHPKPADPRREI